MLLGKQKDECTPDLRLLGYILPWLVVLGWRVYKRDCEAPFYQVPGQSRNPKVGVGEDEMLFQD